MDRIAAEHPPKESRFLGVPTVAVMMDAAYLIRLGELAEQEYEAICKAKS